jgi:hypothetical protein
MGRRTQRVRPSQNWAQKTPKFKAKGQKRGHPKKTKRARKKKEKSVHTYKDICSLENLC